jgi:hypothetical protein
MKQHISCYALAAVTLVIAIAAFEVRSEPPGATKNAPQYTETGELKRPTGYEKWIFVGSNLGIEYRKDGQPVEAEDAKAAPTGNFHNVYINPEAYDHYVRTGDFPEPTIFVLDIFKARPGEPRKVVSHGLFPAEFDSMAVAVKNSRRPDGSTTPWAYYDFSGKQQTAKAFADAACYQCHAEHASDDHVWVQFYPTLRAVKAR